MNKNTATPGEVIPVSDFMTTNVVTAIENQSASYVCKLMCNRKEDTLKFNDIQKKKNKVFDTNKYKFLKENNHNILGYGSGYGIIPRFEGGVGVSCHQTILAKLGYNMDNITSTDRTDVYLIEEDKA